MSETRSRVYKWRYVCSVTCILRDLLVSWFIFASSLAAIVSPLYNEEQSIIRKPTIHKKEGKGCLLAHSLSILLTGVNP